MRAHDLSHERPHERRAGVSFCDPVFHGDRLMREVSFTLNGRPTRMTVDENRMLLWVLRDDLGLTGTKYGCGMALCGSCTVVIDNRAERACATRMRELDGAKVVTIEGLAADGRLHPVQEAFVAHAGYQCGFCTPGMIMTAYALLRTNPKATRDEIVREMDDHICRCGAHLRILQAVQAASTAMKGATE
jgi:aerobic-type carbon monoxide dehydrogenase small subunit (CoxS/CutS family)